MNLNKRKRLSDVQVAEITICKNPAVPGAKFLIMKSTDVPSGDKFESTVVFKAFNDDKQIAYGYVLVPDIEDKQGHVISADEIEKAAHSFLRTLAKREQKGDGTGHEHEDFSGIGWPVESAVDRDGSIAKSFGVSDSDIHKGGWWVGVHMEDEYWALAKSGEITGFSMGGSGKIVEEEVEKSEPIEDTGNVVIDFITKLCGGGKKRKPRRLKKATEYNGIIQKAETYDDITTSKAIIEELIEKTWALLDSIWSGIGDESITSKVGWVKKNVIQFLDDIGSLEELEKSIINKQSDEGDPVMEEKIKLLTEQVTALSGQMADVLTKLEKKETPPTDDKKTEPDPTNVALEALTKSVTDLKSTMDTITKKVETIEKTPAIRSGDDGPTDRDKDDEEDSNTPLHKAAVGTPLSFCSPNVK
jgi:hypothetical protein